MGSSFKGYQALSGVLTIVQMILMILRLVGLPEPCKTPVSLKFISLGTEWCAVLLGVGVTKKALMALGRNSSCSFRKGSRETQRVPAKKRTTCLD